VARFKYLDITAINKNEIYDEVISRINSENAYLYVISYGCEP
jgi:hypothetical protein